MKTSNFILVVIILALLALPGCSCGAEKPPETGITPSSQHAVALAERFCPVFYLKGDDGVVENYEPASIETLVSQALFQETDNQGFSEKASLPGMAQYRSSSYYLDVPDLSPASAPDILPGYKAAYDQLKQEGYAPTVYARVIENVDSRATIVQYWTFYYFNDWRNVHEGDWELVQLVFPGLSAEDIISGGTEPLYAAYSQHQAGQRMSWEDMKTKQLVEDAHPSVYVAKGSHANYFTPGQYWSVLDFDDTGLESWERIEPEQVVLLDESSEAEQEWLSFQGKWGEDLDFTISVAQMTFGQSGPTGPSWGGGGKPSGKWESPVAWAEGLPEYPSPFWTSFIPGLAKFWSKLAVFSVFSPADIHVYDANGRHVGVDAQGEVELGIPGAQYFTPEGTDFKTIVIPEGDVVDGFTVELTGTGAGVMDIKAQVPDEQRASRQFIAYSSVPVTVRTTARLELSVRPQIAVVNDKSDSIRDVSTRLQMDTDGDGVFESQVKPGRTDISPNDTPVTTTTATTKPTLTTTKTTAVTTTTREVRVLLGVRGGGGIVKMVPETGHVAGEKLAVTAVPDPGWVFDHWEGDISGDSPTASLILEEDTDIIAVFRLDTTGLILDQEHAPEWNNGILVSINPIDHTTQSFMPMNSLLAAIDVNLRPMKGSKAEGEYITLNLYDENRGLLATTKTYVRTGVDGWVRFTFDELVALPPGYRIIIELVDEGNYAFGWKFSLENYQGGAATVEGKLFETGDYLFRTYTPGQITRAD